MCLADIRCATYLMSCTNKLPVVLFLLCRNQPQQGKTEKSKRLNKARQSGTNFYVMLKHLKKRFPSQGHSSSWPYFLGTSSQQSVLCRLDSRLDTVRCKRPPSWDSDKGRIHHYAPFLASHLIQEFFFKHNFGQTPHFPRAPDMAPILVPRRFDISQTPGDTQLFNKPCVTFQDNICDI